MRRSDLHVTEVSDCRGSIEWGDSGVEWGGPCRAPGNELQSSYLFVSKNDGGVRTQRVGEKQGLRKSKQYALTIMNKKRATVMIPSFLAF